MANRRISSRRVRGHLTYTVAEVASATGSHKNTVRHWLKSGLSALDGRQPTLIKGTTLKAFIDGRKADRRQAVRDGCTASNAGRQRSPRSGKSNTSQNLKNLVA
jgi:hypothetical protein